MQIDEAMAYAQASWNRFQEEVSDELMRAVCAAFAVVAAADGHVDRSETERLLDVLRSNREFFPKLDFDRVETLFRDLADAIHTDPEAGRRQALAHIAALRNRPVESDLLLSAARIAMLADDVEERRETELIEEIERVLRGPE